MDGENTLAPKSIRSAIARSESGIRRLGQDLIRTQPLLRAPIMRLWGSYIYGYGYCQSWLNRLRSGGGAPIPPFAVVRVDPKRIEHLVESDGYPDQTREQCTFPNPKFKHAGRIVSGDWDRPDSRFDDTDLYRGFEAHFRSDVPWPETRFYRRTIAYLEDGFELWGCRSEADFRRRCAYLDDLYETIAAEGYRSQATLEDAIEPRSGPRRVLGIVTDEITVCVGREGALLFMDGRNRLAIAKILELESIPVWIMVRHADWQRRRSDMVRETGSGNVDSERFRSHPDIEYLLES